MEQNNIPMTLTDAYKLGFIDGIRFTVRWLQAMLTGYHDDKKAQKPFISGKRNHNVGEILRTVRKISKKAVKIKLHHDGDYKVYVDTNMHTDIYEADYGINDALSTLSMQRGFHAFYDNKEKAIDALMKWRREFALICIKNRKKSMFFKRETKELSKL